MKTTTLKFFSVLLIIIYSTLYVQPAYAHGDEARIEISAERLNPGSVLELRGVDFEREAEIALTLVGPQTELPIGRVIADIDGMFLLTFPLPVALAEGMYSIRGTLVDNHTIDSPLFLVFGSADLGSADGEPRAEEDGLLAPMPTIAANAPTPQMASVIEPKTEPAKYAFIPYGWIVLALGIIGVLVLVLRLRR